MSRTDAGASKGFSLLEPSAQQDKGAARLAQDVHGHRRPPLAVRCRQLEEADVVAEEAVVADELAPAAAGEDTAEPVAVVADVPFPLAAGSLKDDVPRGCSQVLLREL